MPARGPSFSPYPFEGLRHITHGEAAFESMVAHWLAARPQGGALAKLVGAPVTARLVGGVARIDPHAALAELRMGGESILLAASSLAIRTFAQRWLGGPDELDAPRPLTAVENGIWCLVAAAAIADLGIDGHVWPALDAEVPNVASPVASATIAGRPSAKRVSGDKGLALAPTIRAAAPVDPTIHATPTRDAHAIEFAVSLGDVAMTVVAFVPRAIELRAPPPRTWPAWSFEIPIVVARAAVARAAIAKLAVRDIITVERMLELEIGDGGVQLRAPARGAVEARVATGYVRRDMALPDDAHLELTVQLGTKRMSLRELAELAVGQVISLERPLAGPFEVRAGGRVVGQGELIDVEGEVGVRIVSLVQE